MTTGCRSKGVGGNEMRLAEGGKGNQDADALVACQECRRLGIITRSGQEGLVSARERIDVSPEL